MRAGKSNVTIIIGPNGSGKSTLLKTIFGLLKPKSGKILYDGRDITGAKPHSLLGRGISYIPQVGGIFPYLTVEDNLRVAGWTLRSKKDEVEDSIKKVCELYPNLKNKLNSKAGDLSGGAAMMLKVAKALIVNPDTLLVDEPSGGLAPKFFKIVYDELKRLAREDKRTVILADQNIRKAMDLADYVYVLDMGKTKMEGPKEEFETGVIKDIIKEWLAF